MERLRRTLRFGPVNGTASETPKALAGFLGRKPSRSENACLEVLARAEAEKTLAYRYANLSDEDALAELARRRDQAPSALVRRQLKRARGSETEERSPKRPTRAGG